jgi:hypothetical protein
MDVLKSFLHSCFALPDTRAKLLQHIMARPRKNAQEERISVYFERFIKNVLYDPVEFCLYLDYFTVFGTSWPIYRSWFVQGNQMLDYLVQVQDQVFDSCQSYENGMYQLTQVKDKQDATVLVTHVKRQWVRDFAWLIWQRNDTLLRQELICAIQAVQVDERGQFITSTDRFLSNLLGALQFPKTIRLHEVLCWNNSQYDLHEEVVAQLRISGDEL